RKKLIGFDSIVTHREDLVARYRSNLPHFDFQGATGSMQAHQFSGLLVPEKNPTQRDGLMLALRECRIGSAKYFSPHLRDHPYFAANSSHSPLPCADALSERIICLPLYDDMISHEVDEVS